MIQEISEKTPDIIIGLVVGMVTGLTCLLIDRHTKGREEASKSAPAQRISLTTITNVTVGIEARQPKSANADPLVTTTLVAAVVGYLFFRDDVLTGALLGSMSVLGVWLVVAIYSLIAGNVSGVIWPIYLLLMMVALCVGSLSVLPAALTPAFPPDQVNLPIDSWQQYAQEYGVMGLVQVLRVKGATWLISHVLGVLLYFVALKDAAFSMVLYALAGSGRLENLDDTSRLARLAVRYSKPFRMLVSVIVLMLAAYYLVSGIFIHWFTTEMPHLVTEFIQYVLNGRHGS